MKTILLISHSSSATGGGEDDFLRLLKYLHGKYKIYSMFPNGPRSELFASFSDKYLIIPNKVFPVYKFEFRGYLAFIIRSIQKLFKMIPFLIKNRDIDLCFINSSVCFVEMLVVNFFKIPYVLSIKEKINPAWIRNLIYKFVSKTSVKIIVISKFLYDLYSKSENYKIKIIHSSIEEDFYQECYNKTEEEKDRNKKFVILNIAAFYDLKNQLSLVNAVNLINNSDDILVKFIGKNVDNKYFDHLLKEIENSKNRNSFEIVGELDKKSLIKEIKKSHCVVITSKEEGQSLVLLEAMFLERAVISTKVGVVSEIIKNYENGLLYDVNDSQTLSEHILKLKNDKELYTGIIKSSKETYHRNFSLERSLRQHEEIFRNAMQI